MYLEQIFEFLQIKKGHSFQPRPVKEVGFDESEKKYIAKKTKKRLEKLKSLGLTNN